LSTVAGDKLLGFFPIDYDDDDDDDAPEMAAKLTANALRAYV
jgi:hypothetical protein